LSTQIERYGNAEQAEKLPTLIRADMLNKTMSAPLGVVSRSTIFSSVHVVRQGGQVVLLLLELVFE
jgi:hypothetical protein